ncbi:amino acid permease [Inquilinus limosus]|uniref:amino acid permease n=1 Tax=Inquilinus limosus TaxID=171674 RepID=UPI00047B708F|nr:amino acid permease [Inquilinus limosus]
MTNQESTGAQTDGAQAGGAQTGAVRYETVDRSYFEKRGLKRYAGVASLWALGVGAVISGDFSGWNFGLGAGGFGGLFYATIIIMIMYLGLTFSLAEMSPAMPHTGGAYSFARSAMGPWAGFITGLTENVEYILTPAVIVFFISTYMGSIFETPAAAMPLWWAGFYLLFVGLNIVGVEMSFRISVLVTVLALAVLAIYWISAIPHFDMALALNIPPAEGHSAWLPFGVEGILKAMPFAVWFFLAIEQLPLAAEESHDPKRDMPKGILLGIFTLILTAFLTLFLVAGVGGGSATMGSSGEPILDGFRAFYGEGLAKLLALAAVIGLVASFHTIIFAFGRQIYSLSRAGYFPRGLSVTHGTRKTPHLALIAGAVVGFAVMIVIWLTTDTSVATTVIGTTLLNMAVFGAMLSYLLQAISFIVLRVRLPHIERPYRSPLGIPGAVLTAGIAIVTLGFQMQDAAYRQAVLPVAVWILIGLAYFLIWGRHKLVLSPEEKFALERGKAAYESH